MDNTNLSKDNEQRYHEKNSWDCITKRMTATPGTIEYNGPVIVTEIEKMIGHNDMDKVLAGSKYMI